MEIKPGYLTIEQAVIYSGESETVIRQAIKDKDLYASKPAKRIRIKIEDLDRWMKKHPAA